MIRPAATLAGPDAQVFDLLQQVVAIARRRGIGDAAAVARIADEHLPHPHLLHRQLVTAQHRAQQAEARAEAAEARADLLAERVRDLEEQLAAHQPRAVQLSALTAHVLQQLAAGRTRRDLAAELGVVRQAISNHVRRAAVLMDTTDPVAAVRQGEVQVQERTRRRSA